MINQYGPVQQQLAQLESLEESQLKQLLVELEAQKRLLPVDDHAIIDWGINALKAKILDEERLMSESDKAWKKFLKSTDKDFIKKYSKEYHLNSLDLKTKLGKHYLYSACFDELWSIFELAAPETDRGDDFKRAIKKFKKNLRKILNDRQEGRLYSFYIKSLRDNYRKNHELKKHYQVYERLLLFLVED